MKVNTAERKQNVFEYFRVTTCTAVRKNRRNLLCVLSRGTNRSSLLVLQFDSAPSVLENQHLY